MQETSISRVLVKGKCPKCREGNMFKFPISNIRNFANMNEHCPNCGLRFEVEPGFFIGAMYISYGFSVAILIATGIILSFMSITNTMVYVLTTFGISLLFLPFVFRISRILFLHWFGGVKYKGTPNS